MSTTFDNIDTEAELRDAIFQLSDDFARGVDNGPYTINITGNIDLTQSLPMIRGLVPGGSAVQITIANALAEGGDGGAANNTGGGGGGGGLGAGAAVFVNGGAAVTLTAVTVE